MSKTKVWYLGKIKDARDPQKIYLYDFSWDCRWYWGGGYIGNNKFHAHFDGAFLGRPDSRGHCLGNFYDLWTKIPDYLEESKVIRLRNGTSVWEPLSVFLDDAQYDEAEWWRIKDLFTQFYAMRKAAEVFHSGGHCSSIGRTNGEIDKDMEATLNKHIETVIIPEIHKVLNRECDFQKPQKALEQSLTNT